MVEWRTHNRTREASMSDSISPAKAEANQRNARKSTGPKDTTSTRLNATKHGLLAQGITELDDAEAYTALLRRLNHAHRPVGDIEAFLVERIALAMVRLRRIARMEAEYITGALHSLNLDNARFVCVLFKLARATRQPRTRRRWPTPVRCSTVR